MKTRTILRATLIGVLASTLLASPAAADTVVKVTADGQADWRFGRDPANVAPWSLTTDDATIGNGSLRAGPIDSAPSSKFIAELYDDGAATSMPVAGLLSIAYDFKIANAPTVTPPETNPARQIYVNVYANLPESTTFYDCRFTQAAASTPVGVWSTSTFSAATSPRSGVRAGVTCPTSLAGMPADSSVSFVALNLGDTNARDIGMTAFFDNVRIATTAGTTVYDFDVDVDADDDGLPDVDDTNSKDDCKKNGWRRFTSPVFKNQGDCVSYHVQA
jgi:hypothetical protein